MVDNELDKRDLLFDDNEEELTSRKSIFRETGAFKDNSEGTNN